MKKKLLNEVVLESNYITDIDSSNILIQGEVSIIDATSPKFSIVKVNDEFISLTVENNNIILPNSAKVYYYNESKSYTRRPLNGMRVFLYKTLILSIDNDGCTITIIDNDE